MSNRSRCMVDTHKGINGNDTNAMPSIRLVANVAYISVNKNIEPHATKSENILKISEDNTYNCVTVCMQIIQGRIQKAEQGGS